MNDKSLSYIDSKPERSEWNEAAEEVCRFETGTVEQSDP